MSEETLQAVKKYYDYISVGNRTKQSVYFVEQHDKMTHLGLFFKEYSASKTVIFTKSKKTADSVGVFLREQGFSVSVAHGNHRASQIEEVANAYNSNEIDILVTTTKIYESMELTEVKMILSYDLPQEEESYFKALRAVDEVGKSILFVSVEDEGTLERLELMMKYSIPQEELEAFTHTSLPKGISSKKDIIKKPRHKKVQQRADKKAAMKAKWGKKEESN